VNDAGPRTDGPGQRTALDRGLDDLLPPRRAVEDPGAELFAATSARTTVALPGGDVVAQLDVDDITRPAMVLTPAAYRQLTTRAHDVALTVVLQAGARIVYPPGQWPPLRFT
jgi:hypothetical protein